MRPRLLSIGFVVLQAAIASAAVPLTAELLSVKKIWDQAPHNAFTDLARWHERFYCAFREGRGHVSTDGCIRVLCSKDADAWSSTGLISLDGHDLRDAHLSVTPDNRLMLLGGAAPREKDNHSAPTGSFVAFSKDGTEWTKPQIVSEPGRWLWCVTWHKGKAYGVSYSAGKGSPNLELLTSDDGITYRPLVPKLYSAGRPGETTLRFDRLGTCYALVRRDKLGDQPYSTILGISRGDYTQWQWHDLGPEFNAFGGPNLLQLPTGHGSTELSEVWLAAGRMHQDAAHTALCYLDMTEHKMTKILKLPSGGDTSYPGLVWHNDLLYLSYYSTHEGKTSIYLAKVKVAGPLTHRVRSNTPMASGALRHSALSSILHPSFSESSWPEVP
ncbi:MAG: exo-alpha-sialidase [Phycisphaerae bacterium]|nr:exo-alpha-sialidase [Phycisphaerae bacterium]